MYNSARVRPLLTNTLTRQCVLLALTKPFTPFYRATRHHARIRLIAVVGDDGCCYCCCCAAAAVMLLMLLLMVVVVVVCHRSR